MRVKWIAGVFVLLVLVSGVLLAQSNETIDECSKAEAQLVYVAISENDFFVDYAAFLKLFGADWSENYQDTLRQLLELREVYYTDIQPSMPDCAAAVRLQLAFSDVFGELTVVISTYNLIKLDSSEYGLLLQDNVDGITQRFANANSTIIDTLTEIIEVAEID